jgi:hypothetical protein
MDQVTTLRNTLRGTPRLSFSFTLIGENLNGMRQKAVYAECAFHIADSRKTGVGYLNEAGISCILASSVPDEVE